jgi:NhaP-type Na+/H+ or K+/H+ antiporter
MARVLVHLPWASAWLVGAALAPTDPVFAAALVGDNAVPRRVQHLLNLESGLNDGLALPIVMTVLAVGGGRGESMPSALFDAVAGGAGGVLIAWSIVWLERRRMFGVSERYRPIAGLAIALFVLAVSVLLGVNEFLAMFSAGVTVSARAPALARAFASAGELMAEVLKLAAVLAFGALMSPALGHVAGREWGFVLAALVLARPLALLPSLVRTPLDWRERTTVAWFGPKGFASVFFGILILASGLSDGERLFRLVALVVAASIVAHSSTDVLAARWYRPAHR